MADAGRDHRISLEMAVELTRRHRRAAGTGAALGGMLGRTAVEELLQQPGCAGLRIYLGRDASDQPTLVLVGVTAAEADLADGIILDQIFPCPPICGTSSPLNS